MTRNALMDRACITRRALVALLVSGLAFSAGAQTQEIVVTPSNPQGWTTLIFGNANGDWDTTHPRSGNGSARIAMNDASSAGVDHYNELAPQSMAGLSRLSYDWYRSSASTSSAVLSPVFALFMSDGDFLVYEREQNAPGAAPTDVWVTENVLGGAYWRYTLASITGDCGHRAMFTTLSDFNTQCYGGNAQFVGFDMWMGGVGPGSFDAAVDNLTYAIGGDAVTYNFEADAVVATPEPASIALLITGLVALVPVARRRR